MSLYFNMAEEEMNRASMARDCEGLSSCRCANGLPEHFSYSPVFCPISACRNIMGATCVLSHFLREHSKDNVAPLKEIHAGDRSVLIFDALHWDFRVVTCLGVLAYGGFNTDIDNRPAERGICRYNTSLPVPLIHLTAHLPIFVMACKTSWSAIVKDKQVEAMANDPNNSSSHMLVIWLASTQKLAAVYCTITIYAPMMMRSRSAFLEIRNINDSQNPSIFLPSDTNALLLNCAEIEYLSQDGDIHLEIMINEVNP